MSLLIKKAYFSCLEGVAGLPSCLLFIRFLAISVGGIIKIGSDVYEAINPAADFFLRCDCDGVLP